MIQRPEAGTIINVTAHSAVLLADAYTEQPGASFRRATAFGRMAFAYNKVEVRRLLNHGNDAAFILQRSELKMVHGIDGKFDRLLAACDLRAES